MITHLMGEGGVVVNVDKNVRTVENERGESVRKGEGGNP